MARAPLLVGLFLALGCDPNVVEAVRDPLPAPPPSMSSMPPPPPSPLETTLIHRYSFDGTGTEVLDSKGAAHGAVIEAELPGTGQLPLAGVRTGQFVDLPNGIVSGLGDATFEVWLTWDGGNPWQRIFDFGSNNNSAGEGEQGKSGVTYLFFATASSSDARPKPTGTPRLVFSHDSVNNEEICVAPDPLPIGVLTHLAAVIQPSEQHMLLYQDGVQVAECVLDRPLSVIKDVNNWLGHSNFVADDDFGGAFDEFRIYGAALTATELAASFAAGPNAGR